MRTRRLCIGFILTAFALGMSFAARAVQPNEMLANPALEARARDIGEQLRCLVCQNQSIDDSDAPLAHDLRVLLRQRLLAGDTDDAARQFIVARYGDYVLLKPPFRDSTLALWLGPMLLFVAAMGGTALFYRRREEIEPPLSEEEYQKVLALMKSEEEEPDQ